MEISSRIFVLIVVLLSCQLTFAQSEKAFCKAVKNVDFDRVQQIIHKLINKNKRGQTYFNGAGSGYQINLSPSFDSITSWLKRQPCVDDAYWDKCQIKELIYPGSSSIGVKFRTKNGIVEKCFLIQEGTTGQVNIFGWRPKIFKSKKILVYKKMYDCKGFIEMQKLNCYPYFKREQHIDGIIPQKLLGEWYLLKLPVGVIDKPIEFRFNSQHELELSINSNCIYGFSEHVSKTAISGVGYKTSSTPSYCFVKQLDNDHIEIEFESLGIKTFSVIYQRKALLQNK